MVDRIALLNRWTITSQSLVAFLLAIILPIESPAQIITRTQDSNLELNKMDNETGPINLEWKTGGGMQFWTDHIHREGYRLQQNAITGHWRLLDADNIRLSWGKRSTCEAVLQRKYANRSTTVPPDSAVILLHGLMRTRGSMASLEKELLNQGFPRVIRFSYASTRGTIADHAAALREVLENLPDQTEFRFVGHSMGNIVVRHLLSDLQKEDSEKILPRCKSMVMLGPPNQGATIARRLAPTGVFGWITGAGGLELGPEWEKLKNNLATPAFPFAIIAGDVSAQVIQNPLTDGSGDFVVSVEEAKLEGSEWLRTVPVLHSFLMDDPKVQAWTIEFLKKH
jgi:pimeloyl-ACP methyl ester carboxylesterase